VTVQELAKMVKKGEVCQMMELYNMTEETPTIAEDVPPAVQSVISKYSQLFADPKKLPPHRKFDHQIPLVPGAAPVNVKPYRYAPHQKSEIEKQVKEMMQIGIIQESTSRPVCVTCHPGAQERRHMEVLRGLSWPQLHHHQEQVPDANC
jgi:hypothetical protein